MNIFKDMNALFINTAYENIRQYVNDFWKLAKEIRTELGTKGYYLDQYLSTIFKVIERFDLVTLGQITNNICWEVIGDCHIILGSKLQKEKSEFFDVVKEYIDNHPVNFDDRHTKVQFYAGNIVIQNLDVLAHKVKCDYRRNILSDIEYLVSNEKYEKISNLIGEKRMEKLNNVMCEAFTFGPIMISAAQQIITRGFQLLCYRDPESSKQIHRLMLGGV